jgi:hypothetical protein
MRKLIGLITLLSALGVFGAAATGALATGSTTPSTLDPLQESTSPASVASPAAPCFANVICQYASPEYESPQVAWACSESGEEHLNGYPTVRSVRNRCGNKTSWLRVGNTSVACLDPGGEAGNVSINNIYIAKEYGSFC